MTPEEITKLLSDLHDEHLVNEPTDIESQLRNWFMYFRDDEARLIYKACYIYIRFKHNKFYPHPSEIEQLKKRAGWLLEIDDREKEEEAKRLEAKEKARIEAPKVDIREGLCKGSAICPYFGSDCYGTKAEQEVCTL